MHVYVENVDMIMRAWRIVVVVVVVVVAIVVVVVVVELRMERIPEQKKRTSCVNVMMGAALKEWNEREKGKEQP
jgi:uncharacterized membrane protein AbrB (regulator of aidB expression)